MDSARAAAPNPGQAFRPWEAVPALLLALAVGRLAASAFTTQRLLDLKLAYAAGVEAWLSGHPENVETWMGAPALAVAMALLSRVVHLRVAEVLFTAANLALAASALFLVWRRLRGRIPRRAWWATLAAAALYAPLVSTVAYRQFNLFVFALALGGFALLRAGRDARGAALIGLSLAVKPLALLLPAALLLRRDTRRAALLAMAAAGAATLASLGVLAWRADDASLLSPFAAFRNFEERARPWLAHSANVSPLALLVRDAPGLVPRELPALRLVALLGVGLAGALLNEGLRDREGRSWEVLAAACALSPMLGAIAWPHYGVLQAPLFPVLAVQFTERRAPGSFWAALLLAFGLVELVAPPVGTLLGHASLVTTGEAPTRLELIRDQALSQLGPYFLVLCAVAWFQRERGARLWEKSRSEA